jgi:uncharacterized membrane protein YkvA (DUF1232 family)
VCPFDGFEVRINAFLCQLEEGEMATKSLGARISQGSLFTNLKNKAVEYSKNPDRLKKLIAKASTKAESIRGGPLKTAWDSLATLFRMIRAYAKREYTEIPWQSLVLIVATILYFLNPIDLIPDFIIGLGYVDDAALIAWTMSAVKSDVDAFREWESSRSTPRT